MRPVFFVFLLALNLNIESTNLQSYGLIIENNLLLKKVERSVTTLHSP